MTKKTNAQLVATMLAAIASSVHTPEPRTIPLSNRAKRSYLKQLKKPEGEKRGEEWVRLTSKM